jgi:hypothetical protein
MPAPVRYVPAMASSQPQHPDDDALEEAYERLGRMLPSPAARALRWLHDPQSRFVRLPLGILFIIASFFWFLPVIGIEFLPVGLLLVAQDVPFLRRPVGRIMLRLLDGVDRMKQWWKRRRARRNRPTSHRGRR